jgi:tripartite-type tricarboxylate transporter receptor subunit TctC
MDANRCMTPARSARAIHEGGNDMTRTATLTACIALTLQAFGVMPLFAKSAYPDRPIRLIVPFATGSATDSSARLYAAELSKQLGQQVIADNRPGAGGAIGMQALAKSAPDGYTLAYAGAGPLAINRSLTPNLPYDVEREIQAVSQAVSSPLMMVISPTLPVKNVKDLIALAKSRPGQLANGSAGNGTVGHLAGEYFKMLTGTNILHVPYKGGAQAAVDVMSGFVQLMFDPATGVAPHVRSGRLRGLAVTGPERTPAFPDIPTVAEAGVPGYEVTTWGGLIAPAGLPKAILGRLNEEMRKAAKSPTLVERYAALGATPVTSATPDEFTAFIRKEFEKWAKVIKASNIKL